jgi:hypothetical protein
MMTYDEFIEKYGDVVVTFSSYYKYCFRYKAVLENDCQLIVEIGGDADDIYRLEVMAGDSYTVSELQPNGGWMNDQSGFTVETFYFD